MPKKKPITSSKKKGKTPSRSTQTSLDGFFQAIKRQKTNSGSGVVNETKTLPSCSHCAPCCQLQVLRLASR